MDSRDWHLEDLEFIDESGWVDRLFYALRNVLFGFAFADPPVRPIGESKTSSRSVLSLSGEAIGFDDPEMLALFDFHRRRFALRNGQIVLTYLILVLVAGVFFVSVTGLLLRAIALSIRSYLTPGGLVLAVLIVCLFLFITWLIALRVGLVITDRQFADTICVRTSVYLLLELSRDHVLMRSDRKRALLLRMNRLAQATRWLSWRTASKDEATQHWIREHFELMERTIRERECWVAAPRATTLADLRQDFYRLATIYITGNYGGFAWPQTTLTPDEPPASLAQRLLYGLPRLVGIALPLAIIGLVLWQPALLQPVGIEASTVTLICIGWLLLAVDVALKLGIVAKIVDLAKGIKDLT